MTNQPLHLGKHQIPAARLSHPHIVTINDLGHHCIAMNNNE